MSKDRIDLIREAVARLGTDIFIEGLAISRNDGSSDISNVASIIVLLFDGVAYSLEKATEGTVTFDDMVAMLMKAHATHNSCSDKKVGSIDEFLKGFSKN